ncbi:MAG: hypothetical protein AVDCRST_MAG62-1868, partial [uncultured Sphingomonas sp.]
ADLSRPEARVSPATTRHGGCRASRQPASGATGCGLDGRQDDRASRSSDRDYRDMGGTAGCDPALLSSAFHPCGTGGRTGPCSRGGSAGEPGRGRRAVGLAPRRSRPDRTAFYRTL